MLSRRAWSFSNSALSLQVPAALLERYSCKASTPCSPEGTARIEHRAVAYAEHLDLTPADGNGAALMKITP